MNTMAENKSIHAQLSIEFIIATAIVMLIVITALIPLKQMFASKAKREADKALEDLGLNLQAELITAATVKPGYKRIIHLPERINGFDYNITISKYFLSITYENGELSFPIPYVNGTFKKDANASVIEKLENGEIRITSR